VRPVLLGVLLLGCAPATAPAPEPAIAFVEAPGTIREWRFDVHGLPATDTQTGEVVVADVAHGNIVASLSLSILSLRPNTVVRATAILEDAESLGVLYEMEDPAEEARATADLAGRVRARTRAASRALEARDLRPLEPCRLAAGEALFCTHPQRVVCGKTEFELDGDVLRGPASAVHTGWQLPSMEIGDGPPKTMLACIEEAHFDPVTRQLAVRLDHVCRGGGGDACILPDEWHVVAATHAREGR